MSGWRSWWSADTYAVTGENFGDGVRVFDGAEDLHAALTVEADGDVDIEHTGEKSGPGDPGWCGGSGRFAGGQLDRAVALKQRQLNDDGRGGRALESDRSSQMMAGGKDAAITNPIEARRRDEDHFY